jgi:hypothetical protein
MWGEALELAWHPRRRDDCGNRQQRSRRVWRRARRPDLAGPGARHVRRLHARRGGRDPLGHGRNHHGAAGQSPASPDRQPVAGGTAVSCPTEFASAISDARSRDSLVVVAAGNSGVDAVNHAPANCPDAVTRIIGTFSPAPSSQDRQCDQDREECACGPCVRSLLALNRDSRGRPPGTRGSTPSPA